MTTLGGRQTTKQSSYRNVTTNNTTATNAKKVVAAAAPAVEATPEPPTARQLVTHAVKCAIPMIGFGFMVRGFNISYMTERSLLFTS